LAEGAKVVFSTGHEMYFDLRYREAHADDGQLHADKEGARVINLPSGEAYIAPYEGERNEEPSKTEGMIPVMLGEELVVARVEANRIVEVIGEGTEAAEARAYLALDDALRNVAELGLGCNESAVVTGNVLEDEKVMGMHWAFGLSEHIGGTVGVDDFSDPGLAEHRDWVYPKGGAIEIASLVLEYSDGTSEEIIHDGEYTTF
jgi:leucyl aminopeptidase (aminopeptidase T)